MFFKNNFRKISDIFRGDMGTTNFNCRFRRLPILFLWLVAAIYFAHHMDVINQRLFLRLDMRNNPMGKAEIFRSVGEDKKQYLIWQTDNMTRAEIFRSVAEENLIIVSTTDDHYLDLALNLYLSMEKLNIKNYIIGCTDLKACEELKKRNIK